MLRIAVTGPESSGKTTLCTALEEHYQVPHIPEYARTYLEQTQGQYQCSDLDIIAQGQLESLLSFNFFTIAFPIPPDAPVIIIFLFVRSLIFLNLLYHSHY